VNDGECSDGKFCSAGNCLRCDASTPCTNGRACCSGTCIDTSKDEKNCGACGVACSGTQFCNGTACKALTFENACANPRAVLVLDGETNDNAAGNVIADGFDASCGMATLTSRVAQTDATVLQQSSGKPLPGVGTTVISAGGPFLQKTVSYFEQSLSPVYFASPATDVGAFMSRASGSAVAQATELETTPSHDFFVVELVKEPSNGGLSLISYGFDGPGTRAGAYYVKDVMLPSLSGLTKAWYVFEWTDQNADTTPNSGDLFTEKGSGP
jgi:hypothetical protein